MFRDAKTLAQGQPPDRAPDHDPFTYHALQLLRGVLWGSALVGVGIGVFAFGQNFSWNRHETGSDASGVQAAIADLERVQTSAQRRLPTERSSPSSLAATTVLPTTEIERLSPALAMPASRSSRGEARPAISTDAIQQRAGPAVGASAGLVATTAASNSSGTTSSAPPGENSLDVLLGVPPPEREQASPVDVFLEIPAD